MAGNHARGYQTTTGFVKHGRKAIGKKRNHEQRRNLSNAFVFMQPKEWKAIAPYVTRAFK